MINITLFTLSLDKLEKRDEMMLKTQEKLLKKLDDANQIEIQKMDLFNFFNLRPVLQCLFIGIVKRSSVF